MRKPFHRKFTKSWYVLAGGKQVNLGPEKAEAFRRWHELLAETADVPALDTKADVAEVIGLFLEWVERNKAAATFAWYSHFLKSFSAFAGHVKVAALRPFHVTRWREKHGYTGNTGNGAVRTVTAAFNWAAKEGYLRSSPIKGVEKPAATPRTCYLEPAQWSKLLKAADGPFLDLLLFLRLTGCRPMEARNLEARHVVGESIVFPVKESKGKRRQRVIPLNEQALAIVRRLALKTPEGPIFRNADGAEWSRNALVCRFRRLRKTLGFHVCAYAIRHTYITDALLAGVDPITLSRMVGHADLKMIQTIYAKVEMRANHMKAAAETAVKGVA